MIIGPPRAGKTKLAIRLATEIYKDCFDFTVYVTPSPMFGIELAEGYNYFKKLEAVQVANAMKQMDLEYTKSKNFAKNKNEKGHLLLVLDDCVAELS